MLPGLASQGMLPVVCIYSTFLQRSYDQIIHDVNLLQENVVFAIDRAGFVPADGETHQGIYDPAFLSQLGMPLYAPSNYQELSYWLQQLLSDRFHGPRAIRYPRGGQDTALAEFGCTGEDYDFLRKADDATIVLVSYADELADLLQAERELQQKSIACDVIKAVKLYPFTDKIIADLSKYKIILFAEECVANGSIGEHLEYALQQKGWNGRFIHCAVRNACLPHASVAQIKQAPVWMQRILYRPFGWPGKEKIYCEDSVGSISSSAWPDQSRERAKALIMSGVVFVNEQKVDKAGEMIKEDAKVEVRGHDIGYVSRGGLKLEKAMKCFPLTPNGKVCMDIGASTGGFTDCMLQNGAVKVYAVDVGYGQLAWSLRTDERVVNMERTNIRNVTPEHLAEPIEFFSVDVSFISLHHIFPVAQAITTPDAMGVCLVKPQFEAGREKVGKNGVVRDPATHREVLHNAMGYAAANGFTVRGLDFSPVKGPEGNIEYLMFVQKSDEPAVLDDSVAEQVVAASHSTLDR